MTQKRPSRLVPAAALNDLGSGVSEVHWFRLGSNRSRKSSGFPVSPTMPAAT